MDAKWGHSDVLIKTQIDKRGYYDVELKGVMQKRALWCGNQGG